MKITLLALKNGLRECILELENAQIHNKVTGFAKDPIAAHKLQVEVEDLKRAILEVESAK